MLKAYSRIALPKVWAKSRSTNFKRVDAEPVDVVPRDRILIGEDQRVADGKDRSLPGVGDELLERLEVAARLSALALAPEEALRCSSAGHTRPSGSRCSAGMSSMTGEVRPCVTGLVTPLDGPSLRVPGAELAQALVAEYVSRMVQHDVEDRRTGQVHAPHRPGRAARPPPCRR